MKPKLTPFFLILALFLIPDHLNADIIYNDGLVHTIDSEIIDEPVYIYNSLSDAHTTLNIEPYVPPTGYAVPLDTPGFTEGIWAYDNSRINISAGTITSLRIYDNSRVSIARPTETGTASTPIDHLPRPRIPSPWLIPPKIDILEAYGSSKVSISFGLLGSDIVLNDHSQVDFTDGSFFVNLESCGNSQVSVKGGNFGALIIYAPGGSIHEPATDIFVRDNSRIIIYGEDFKIDDISVGYGRIDVASGILSGTLDNGGYIYTDFYVYDNASIILVPEPATLILLSFGGIILLRKYNGL